MSLTRRLSLIIILTFTLGSVGLAQSDDPAKLRAEAFRLMDEQKTTEALPLLEKLAGITPNDAAVQRQLAFALLGRAKNTADPAAAKQFRVRARARGICKGTR